MSKEIEILDKNGGALVPPIEVESNHDMIVNIKASLIEKWVTTDVLAAKIWKLLNAKTRTNGWIEYDDNVTQLNTVKLALQLWGIKGIGNAPIVAIFNNMPKKDEKLQY